MARPEIERYEHLAALTARIARAAAELQAALAAAAGLPPSRVEELSELVDRLQALHLVLANETERAWNAAEAAARRERWAELRGRLHDAVSAETTLPLTALGEAWQRFGVDGPEGPPNQGLGNAEQPPDR